MSCRNNHGKADLYSTLEPRYLGSCCVLVSVQQLTSTGPGSADSLLFKALCVSIKCEPLVKISCQNESPSSNKEVS